MAKKEIINGTFNMKTSLKPHGNLMEPQGKLMEASWNFMEPYQNLTKTPMKPDETSGHLMELHRTLGLLI